MHPNFRSVFLKFIIIILCTKSFKDIPESIAMNEPERYQPNIGDVKMNRNTMLRWFLRALFQAIMLFFITISVSQNWNQGTLDYDSIGVFLFAGYLWIQVCSDPCSNMSVLSPPSLFSLLSFSHPYQYLLLLLGFALFCIVAYALISIRSKCDENKNGGFIEFAINHHFILTYFHHILI